MRGRPQAERHERLGTCPEPGADHDRVRVDTFVVGEFDRLDVPVPARHDAPRRAGNDVDTGRSQYVEPAVLEIDTVGDDHGEPGGELAEQPGPMEILRMGDDLHDALITEFVAVAERAVDHLAPPVLRESVDVGQLVHQTGCRQHPARHDGVPTDELDAEAEARVVGAGHLAGTAGDNFAAVAAYLLAPDCDQLGRSNPFMAEIAVHVRGRGVARVTAVDDDHRAALTTKLDCGGEAGGRSADDGYVAVALDQPVCVLTHGFDDMVTRLEPHGLLRYSQEGRPESMATQNEIERTVRTRLRSLRTTLGLSLDELAARTNLSPSTISRVETGKRTISLDILLPLAAALQVDLDALLDVRSDDDVVIRPTPSSSGRRTTWLLSRPTGSTIAVKMRLEPTRKTAQQRVHPGHDWFFVLEGRVGLSLGDREIAVETGEAAEFATMTPHAFRAIDGPAEIITIFDRDGQRAHVHQHSGHQPI
jgi:transcriptional regulator with XRE-family HTH domain